LTVNLHVMEVIMSKLANLLKVIGISLLIMACYFVGAIFSILLSPVVIGLIAIAVYKLNNNQKTNNKE
jgi:type III secretory pathway component EscT